jgi:hypothetical protein
VSIRPPALPQGAAALWGWAAAAITTSDQDLLLSCGLDAFMFVKVGWACLTMWVSGCVFIFTLTFMYVCWGGGEA